MTKRILIITYSLVKNDAIGNDLRTQAEILKKAGYEVWVFAPHFDDFNKKSVCKITDAHRLLSDPSCAVILHHSCYLPQMKEFLSLANGPLILRYHNITPPEYFTHNKHIQRDLVLGRLQCQEIVNSGKVSIYLGASTYNNLEFISLGAPEDCCRTLAPFHLTEDFKTMGINPELQSIRNQDKRLKVLFVGRMMRHKGQIHLIDTIKHYADMYDSNILLTLVGRIENEAFARALEECLNNERLSSFVDIHQDASVIDLHTYYLTSDVFLMMSEHEGFGVPILEAQFHKLPIVALDRAAIKETIGIDQLTFQELDPAVMASALRRLKEDGALRDYLVQEGLKNYEKYSKEKLSNTLLNVIQDLPV